MPTQGPPTGPRLGNICQLLSIQTSFLLLTLLSLSSFLKIPIVLALRTLLSHVPPPISIFPFGLPYPCPPPKILVFPGIPFSTAVVNRSHSFDYQAWAPLMYLQPSPLTRASAHGMSLQQPQHPASPRWKSSAPFPSGLPPYPSYTPFQPAH